MAGKKSKKVASPKKSKGGPSSIPALGMLQDLLSQFSEEEKLGMITAIMGSPPPDHFFMSPKAKPPTKTQREIARLVEQARSQDSTNEALPFLLQAEEGARKAVGKKFEKLAGQMADDAAGETYLEVKIELAQALNAAGQREAALTHLEEVYRLDPDDPLEARALLLAAYFELDRNDDAARLLDEECPEPWAGWLFGRLLRDLRRGSRGPEAEKHLKAAHRANPFVLSLLLNARMPDPIGPEMVETGEDSEAQEYAANFLPAWKNTPGAISWLRETAARLNINILAPNEEPPQARRLSARDYASLPVHQHATWVVGQHEMGTAQLPGEDRPSEHWLVFALSTEGDLVGFDLRDRQPSASSLWQGLTEYMLDEDGPGRPQKMLVYPATLLPQLKKEAAKAKIALEPHEQAAELVAMLDQLTERVQGGTLSAASLDPEAIRNAPLDVDEVWEAAVVELERRLNVAGQSLRPWVALVMSRASGMILWHELFTEAPPEGALASAVRMAIARPAMGTSCRPRQVIVRDPDEAVALHALSDEVGFECLAENQLPMINDAVAHLTNELLGGETEVVLSKGEGVTPDNLERYYTAAASFFRAQPWKQFAMDEVIGLDHEGQPGRRFALVMGQSGITLGVAIYERLQDIETMFVDRSSEGRAFDSFSVMFGEDASISPADLDAIERFGWPIATPEAYPDALRIHPGPKVETPTADELAFLTAALEAIAWLTKHKGEKTTSVAVANKNLTATRLGWVGSIDAGPR